MRRKAERLEPLVQSDKDDPLGSVLAVAPRSVRMKVVLQTISVQAIDLYPTNGLPPTITWRSAGSNVARIPVRAAAFDMMSAIAWL